MRSLRESVLPIRTRKEPEVENFFAEQNDSLEGWLRRIYGHPRIIKMRVVENSENSLLNICFIYEMQIQRISIVFL